MKKHINAYRHVAQSFLLLFANNEKVMRLNRVDGYDVAEARRGGG
jgi:hypothetical protein